MKLAKLKIEGVVLSLEWTPVPLGLVEGNSNNLSISKPMSRQPAFAKLNLFIIDIGILSAQTYAIIALCIIIIASPEARQL